MSADEEARVKALLYQYVDEVEQGSSFVSDTCIDIARELEGISLYSIGPTDPVPDIAKLDKSARKKYKQSCVLDYWNNLQEEQKRAPEKKAALEQETGARKESDEDGMLLWYDIESNIQISPEEYSKRYHAYLERSSASRQKRVDADLSDRYQMLLQSQTTMAEQTAAEAQVEGEGDIIVATTALPVPEETGNAPSATLQRESGDVSTPPPPHMQIAKECAEALQSGLIEEDHASQIQQDFATAEGLAQQVLWNAWTEALAKYGKTMDNHLKAARHDISVYSKAPCAVSKDINEGRETKAAIESRSASAVVALPSPGSQLNTEVADPRTLHSDGLAQKRELPVQEVSDISVEVAAKPDAQKPAAQEAAVVRSSKKKSRSKQRASIDFTDFTDQFQESEKLFENEQAQYEAVSDLLSDF
jgi:hypothetical protein